VQPGTRRRQPATPPVVGPAPTDSPCLTSKEETVIWRQEVLALVARPDFDLDAHIARLLRSIYALGTASMRAPDLPPSSTSPFVSATEDRMLMKAGPPRPSRSTSTHSTRTVRTARAT
jgi:hypothetical protein